MNRVEAWTNFWLIVVIAHLILMIMVGITLNYIGEETLLPRIILDMIFKGFMISVFILIISLTIQFAKEK